MKPETMLLRDCFVAFERGYTSKNLTALSLATAFFGVSLGISGCETGTQGGSGFIQEKGTFLGEKVLPGLSPEIRPHSELDHCSSGKKPSYVLCDEELNEGAVALQALLLKEQAPLLGRFYRSGNQQPVQAVIYVASSLADQSASSDLETPSSGLHPKTLVLDTWPDHFTQLKISYFLHATGGQKPESTFELLSPEGDRFQFKAFYCPQKAVLVLRDPNGSKKNQREIVFQRKEKCEK